MEVKSGHVWQLNWLLLSFLRSPAVFMLRGKINDKPTFLFSWRALCSNTAQCDTCTDADKLSFFFYWILDKILPLGKMGSSNSLSLSRLLPIIPCNLVLMSQAALSFMSCSISLLDTVPLFFELHPQQQTRQIQTFQRKLAFWSPQTSSWPVQPRWPSQNLDDCTSVCLSLWFPSLPSCLFLSVSANGPGFYFQGPSQTVEAEDHNVLGLQTRRWGTIQNNIKPNKLVF